MKKIKTDDVYKTFLIFGGCLAIYMTCFIFVDLSWWNIILPLILATITTAKILDNDKKENNKRSLEEKRSKTKKKVKKTRKIEKEERDKTIKKR